MDQDNALNSIECSDQKVKIEIYGFITRISDQKHKISREINKKIIKKYE